ncbi:AraC family transcriptional regulator [Nocardia mexicana]|nr:AraC family transcriptional regulator [Nocardia mexicana]
MRIHNRDTEPADRLDHWNELTRLTRYGASGMPEIRGDRTFAADYTASWFGDTGVVAGEMDEGVFVMDRRRTDTVDSGRVQLMLTGNAPHIVDLGSDRREIAPRSVILQFNDQPRSTLRPSHDHMLFVDIDAGRLTVDPEILRRSCFTALPVDAGLVELFAQAALRLLSGQRQDPQAAGTFLVSLVDLVVRNAFAHELALTETVPARRVQALRVMRENLSNAEFGAVDLAAALNISRRSLFQLFDDGEPPMSVLRRMRVAFAKNILSDPNQDILTMDQIAKLCGFRTARGLGIAFQREFGRAPSDYRRIRPATLPDGVAAGPEAPVCGNCAS